MRRLVAWGITGAVAGVAIAVVMISIDQTGAVFSPVNGFFDRAIIWLCPFYILGFSTDVTSKTEWFLITIAGNALLYGVAFALVAKGVALARKAALRLT